MTLELQIDSSSTTIEASNGASAKFAELLEEYESPRPRRGQILKGKVLRIADDVVYVDVGAKRDAIVPHEEMDQLADELLEEISPGDEVPVYVTSTPVGDEELIVSLERGLEQRDWERAEELEGDEETVELTINGYNKGGVVVKFGRLDGFVPNSHLPQIKHIHDREQRFEHKSDLVGEILPVRVIETNRRRRRLVLSATAPLKELRRERLENLEPGHRMDGRVVGLKNYGAFVEIGDGDLTGLLHISEMDWVHVDHPSDVVSVGDEIEVMIKDVDPERERISLSRKAVIPNPWQTFAERHQPGDLIESEISSLVDFGAFVKLQSGIEGLIHVSEIDLYGGASVSEIYEEGQKVLARIKSIDPSRERLGLSVRQVTPEEEINWMSENREQ